MSYQFPYCTFDKLRISNANGLKFRYLTGEGSFFEGETIQDNTFYNEDSNCGFNWEPFAQKLPCDGTIRIQFQWCDENTPLVHLFQNDEFVVEINPLKVYSGSYDIYEVELNFGTESEFCNSCIDLRIATGYEGNYNYHAQSEPIHVSTTDCLIPIEYWNDDNYDGQYFCNGFKNIVYIEAQFITYAPIETSSVYVTSNNIKRVLSKNIAKKRTLDINYIPEYMHDIVIIAFSMDNLTINGKSFTAESEYKIQDNNTLYSLCKASIEVYENLYKFENSNCDNECGGNQPATPACTLPDSDGFWGGNAEI